MKKNTLCFLSLFTLLFIFIPLKGQAANLEAYKNIELKATETISGNLYAISPKITIDGELEGDLIAISQNIEINGRINGDLIAVAENININGEINGNLRVVAKKLIVNGIISRNVNFFSQNFIVAENGKIGWDILGLSQNNIILGIAQGNVDIFAQKTELKGKILGNLKLHNQENAYLNIHSEAVIEGDLYHQTDLELIRQDGSQINGLNYEIASNNSNKRPLFDWWQIIIYQIISGFIIALLLIKIKRSYLLKLNTKIYNKPWLDLLWGLAFLVLTPLAIIILTVSIIGIPVAIIVAAIYIIAIFTSKIFFAFFLGRRLLQCTKLKIKNNFYLATLLGIIILALLISIPIIGYFISVLSSSFVIGLVLININK